MVGLDKILNEIRENAEKASANIISDAEKTASEILTKAKTDAISQSDFIKAKSIAEEENILSRFKSEGELAFKKSISLEKQKITHEIIAHARGHIISLPVPKYFELLTKLLNKFATGKKGEIRLGKRDIDNMPKSFKSVLKSKNLTLSQNPLGDSGGFILVYGGIEENCTIDSLIQANRDNLIDLINHAIFYGGDYDKALHL